VSEIEILKGARELLSDESKWRRDIYIEEKGNVACGYCIMGATTIAAAGRMPLSNRADELLRDALPLQYQGSIADFNDDPKTTHADVLALLDRAIAQEASAP
jgi:hypothetical protein